jgi:protein-disulfide isomerase
MLKISKIALVVMILASVLLAAGCGGGAGTSAPAETSTPSGARVHIIIYADPQCFACHTVHTQIEPKIIEQYVKTGKATLETRYTSIKGPVSSLAAQAMLCAGDQGKGEEYREKILAAWASQYEFAYKQERLESAAADLGLDAAAFRGCLVDGKYVQQIADNTIESGKLQLETLPMILINDYRIEGVQPWSVVSQVIEDQLKK